MSWDDCRANGFVKEVRIDSPRIRSLRENAHQRMRTAQRIELDATTCSVLVTLRYDTLREFLEALALEYGYHIYNHVCYESLLREIIHEQTMAKRFATLRAIRNRINYYGARVEVSEAKRHIAKAQRLIEQTKTLGTNRE